MDVENLEFLDEFIKQAGTDNLKTAHYPKNFDDLSLRVSFGQGSKARVPQCQIVSPDRPTTDGYYHVNLFYKEQNILVLSYGIGETYDSDSWNNEIHTTKTRIDDLIERPFRYGNSYVSNYYKPSVDGDSVKYFTDGVEISNEQMIQNVKSIVADYRKCMDLEIKDETSVVSTGLFYMERQLEDFIIHNWEETELGRKYDLIYEEGELKSRQFNTEIGRIDILAKDKFDNNSYVVIELKRNQTSDETIGQITRYMVWVKNNIPNSKVKGIIIAGKYDGSVRYAIDIVPDIDVFLYQVDFKLNEYIQ